MNTHFGIFAGRPKSQKKKQVGNQGLATEVLFLYVVTSYFSLTVSQTLKGSSRLKGFHTLGWRAFGVRGCAGAGVLLKLTFPNRIARTHVPRS